MANRAFFRSSPCELTAAMALQAVSRTASPPVWSELHTAGTEPGPDSTQAELASSPSRNPEPSAVGGVRSPRGAQGGRSQRAQPDVACAETRTSAECEGSARVGRALRGATEQELLSGLLEGDNGAWQEFDRRYSRLIQSCIRRATAQFPAVGPDDTQEIEAMLWVQLLAHDRRKLRGFEPERGCALSTWIGMLAIHCAYDYLRALRREPLRVALADAEQLSSQLPDPADLYAAREHAARLEAALQCFSARDREFVRLYFGEGLEAEQVAGQMGISIKTVYSKKHKIRLRLESAIAQGRLAA
jgi:RNA polymerase sigma-70 factor (ECF subfamily)